MDLLGNRGLSVPFPTRSTLHLTGLCTEAAGLPRVTLPLEVAGQSMPEVRAVSKD